MKLAEWARANGVHPQTAYRWFREDRIPVPARRLDSGAIWVDTVPADEPGRVVVYARVSSHDQRRDLDRQVARLTERAAVNGHLVVVAEHRDRLARFGTEHLEAALGAHGRKVVVTGPGEAADDLARDMTEVLTWMCARPYGRRGTRNRAMRAVSAAKSEADADG